MEVRDVCVGIPYNDKQTGEEKKRWTRVGVCFLNKDEQNGELKVSFVLDANPSPGMNLIAFKRKPKEGYTQQNMPPAPSNNTANNGDPSYVPVTPETGGNNQDDIKIEDIPF